MVLVNIGKPKKITLPSNGGINISLLTFPVKPTQLVYDFDYYNDLLTFVIATLRINEWGACAEPYKEAIKSGSTWHIHIGFPYKDRKQISPNMLAKIAHKIDQAWTAIDFSKHKKDLASQIHAGNQIEYCQGNSVKDESMGGAGADAKTHYDGSVLCSPGWPAMKLAFETKINAAKKEKEDLGGCDPLVPKQWCLALIEAGMTVDELYDKAKAENRVDHRLYIMEHHDMLNKNAKWQFDRKMRLKLANVVYPPMNEFQEWATGRMMTIKGTRDEGQLNWIVDPEGHAGKSMLQDMWKQKHGSIEFHNAKSSDIATAYNYEKLVTFNFTQHNDMSRINYSVIESFLDGKMFAGKYVSGMKMNPDLPQVWIFSNDYPMMIKPDGKPTMSRDRWNIWLVNKNTRTRLFDQGVEVNQRPNLKRKRECARDYECDQYGLVKQIKHYKVFHKK